MDKLELKPELLADLKQEKNLLAFSHGIDSTALFYLLEENSIKFDLAFVNYQTREQSFEEEEAARILAKNFSKEIFVLRAEFDLEASNFEQKARALRHNFFLELAEKHSYKNILFAHQLNDVLEWFFMQMSKGSGIVNLLSMEEKEKKGDFFYFRPLLAYSKDELLAYLQERKLKYFVDASNSDEKFKRNFIRANFSNAFLAEYKSGIRKTLDFLREERKLLLGEFIYEKDDFFVIKKNAFSMNLIDKACKKLGILLSQKQREELLKGDCVLSSKIIIVSNEKYYFVTKVDKKIMPKDFKEKCRILKIPKLLRSSLLQRKEIFEFFK